MSDSIEDYLMKLEYELINGNWSLVKISEEWIRSFDTEAGVYAVKEEGKICYVEETRSIRERMKDLLDTRNHLLRRAIRNKILLNQKGYEYRTKDERFSTRVEEELNRIFEDNFEIAVIVVKIGRKELEERLVGRFNPIYNSKNNKILETPQKAYSISEVRKKYENAYRPWNEEDEIQLINLSNEGKKAKEIGDILGRNEGAILSRLRKIQEREE